MSSKNVVVSPWGTADGELLPVEGVVSTASGVSNDIEGVTLKKGVTAIVVEESTGDDGVDVEDDVATTAGATGVVTVIEVV